MYNNTRLFSNDLVLTYETILDLSKINGDSGIANRKRQETYANAVIIVKETDICLNILNFVNNLDLLTEKPKKIMKELFAKGQVILEKKEPYNGVTIKNGKIVDGEIDKNLEAFKNLSVLTGIGIGVGDSGIKELIKMEFKTIDQLKIIYEENKFVNFRKNV